MSASGRKADVRFEQKPIFDSPVSARSRHCPGPIAVSPGRPISVSGVIKSKSQRRNMSANTRGIVLPGWGRGGEGKGRWAMLGDLAILLLHLNINNEKAKPAERRGRKATGPRFLRDVRRHEGP